ncbi:2-amino-4-hydroxy-6-hydroxymethyldihydropteridinediphosphokinase [soil metagenome]
MWLGLGTNLGDRAANLASALTALAGILDIEKLSAVYETQPFGYADQPVFWNMALRGLTRLSPGELLTAIKRLEPVLGRTASFHMGPRAIDIDILLYDDVQISTASLTVPHPGLLERAFVLRPLLDLDSDLRDPVTGARLAHCPALDNAPGILRIGSAEEMLPPGTEY